MRIYSANQIRRAEEFTTKAQGLKSGELMERVAEQLLLWLEEEILEEEDPVHLFCGVGDNGGDGLALARLLWENGFKAQVYVVDFGQKRSPGFLLNLDRLKGEDHGPEFLGRDSTLPELGPMDIVVDAIFGIGLSRPPEPWVGRLIEHLNASGSTVYSLDIPSGLPMARAPWDPAHVVRAHRTFSVQWPKLVFFLPTTGEYTRHWDLVDIDMEPEYDQLEESEFELLGAKEAFAIYRPRSKFDHKGDFGHALIIGGSHGKIGAVQLAASAALSTGCGMATAHVPECGYHSLQTAVPDLMVLTDREARSISEIALPFEPAAIGIGMGMGTDERTVRAFAALLKAVERPMVIDADALNILASHPELFGDLPPNSILTPHPKELERLIGPWGDDFEKLELAKAFAARYQVVLLIKGAHTMTLSKDGCYVNGNGNPGMATAGSGDVLAGMLTSLLAQGYPPLQAAAFGVFLHGLAGDLATLQNGFEAVRAPKIVEKIGTAYLSLLLPSEPDDWDPEAMGGEGGDFLGNDLFDEGF